MSKAAMTPEEIMQLRQLYRETASGNPEAIRKNNEDLSLGVEEDTEEVMKQIGAYTPPTNISDTVALNTIDVGYARKLLGFKKLTDPTMVPGFINTNANVKLRIITINKYGGMPQEIIAEPGFTTFTEYMIGDTVYVPESNVLSGNLDERNNARKQLVNNLLYKEDQDFKIILAEAISEDNYDNTTSWGSDEVTTANLRRVVSWFADNGMTDESKIIALMPFTIKEALNENALATYKLNLADRFSGTVLTVPVSERDGDLKTTFEADEIYFIYNDTYQGRIWSRGNTNILQMENRRGEYLVGYRGDRALAMGIFDPYRFYKVTITA